MMKIIDKIKAKSSSKNRREGKILTILAAVLPAVAHNPWVEVKPELKFALDIGAIVVGALATDKALKTEEDLPEHKKD